MKLHSTEVVIFSHIAYQCKNILNQINFKANVQTFIFSQIIFKAKCTRFYKQPLD